MNAEFIQLGDEKRVGRARRAKKKSQVFFREPRAKTNFSFYARQPPILALSQNVSPAPLQLSADKV